MYNTENNMDIAVIRVAKIALITVGSAIVIGTAVTKLPSIKDSINFGSKSNQSVSSTAVINNTNNNNKLPVVSQTSTPVAKPTPTPTPTKKVNKPVIQSNKSQENQQIIKSQKPKQQSNQGQVYTEPSNTQQTDTEQNQQQQVVHYKIVTPQPTDNKYEYQQEPVSNSNNEQPAVQQQQDEQQSKIIVQQPVQQTEGQQAQTQQSNGISIGSENPQ